MQLQRELNRTEKALAEAAALLVLQKKYRTQHMGATGQLVKAVESEAELYRSLTNGGNDSHRAALLCAYRCRYPRTISMS